MDDNGTTVAGGPPSNIAQNDEELKRFQVELEFVQCLANPFYLNHLAQHGYFEQREFVNYLKYLLYWKEPNYAIFIKYPACLYLLDLLQEEAFRRELISPLCAKFVEEQLLLHWQYYAFRRQMAAAPPPAATDAAGSAAAGVSGGSDAADVPPSEKAGANGPPTLQNGT